MQVNDQVVLQMADGVGSHVGTVERTRNAYAYVRWNNGFGAWVLFDDLRAAECTGCGSTETINQILEKHPNALSCCPERDMR